jgi:hypothetical protein
MRVARETYHGAVPVAVARVVSVAVTVTRITVRRIGRSVRRAFLLVVVMRPAAGSTGPRRGSRVAARRVRLLRVVLCVIGSVEDPPQIREQAIVAHSIGLSAVRHERTYLAHGPRDLHIDGILDRTPRLRLDGTQCERGEQDHHQDNR